MAAGSKVHDSWSVLTARGWLDEIKNPTAIKKMDTAINQCLGGGSFVDVATTVAGIRQLGSSQQWYPCMVTMAALGELLVCAREHGIFSTTRKWWDDDDEASVRSAEAFRNALLHPAQIMPVNSAVDALANCLESYLRRSDLAQKLRLNRAVLAQQEFAEVLLNQLLTIGAAVCRREDIRLKPLRI